MSADSGEQAVSRAILSKLESDPAHYLAEYTRRFGNVLNADNAATLFAEYNDDPARYRVAVHPAAQWIRDELFRLALMTPGIKEKNRVVFTAGGNAAGKSTVIDFAATSEKAQIVFDSTFSNPDHARRLVHRALNAGKAISIVYVNRPLGDAFKGMLERAESQGRVVTIEQLIGSQRGAAETVRSLWEEFSRDARFIFTFLNNSAENEAREGGIEVATPQDYTENRRYLHELLDATLKAGRITGTTYARIGGRGREQSKSPSGQA